MPGMNKTGPDGLGIRTGRMLGDCFNPDFEIKQSGTLGVGQGKRRHSANKNIAGKGKRLKYFQTKDKNNEWRDENCSFGKNEWND